MAFEFPLDADVCFGAFMRCFGAVIQRRVGSMEPRCIASIDRGSSAYQLIGGDMPAAVMLMRTAAKTAMSAGGGLSFRDIDVQASMFKQGIAVFVRSGCHRQAQDYPQAILLKI
ncbi:hypothetical protein [Burkholderia sp. AU45388]|uniref:hypothetical protein n=1 Tax=Burkholderia sp. AU45388 TaxID=3059206 RepID=UPI00264D4CA5|nr:hypothetical protein [Burkholderia sp. AU45388]MDN7429094.1 hypothetical protein [Burkholderia sp. AU45388]